MTINLLHLHASSLSGCCAHFTSSPSSAAPSHHLCVRAREAERKREGGSRCVKRVILVQVHRVWENTESTHTFFLYVYSHVLVFEKLDVFLEQEQCSVAL